MTKQDMIDVIKVVMNYLYKDVGDTWYGDLLSDVLEELNNGDVETVVRCKNCKHKPSGDSANHDIEFPDEICPCQCEDYWYSWIPRDNFFCAWGEKREDETVHG